MNHSTTISNSIKYIVFDFDGTLANTMEAILEIAEQEIGPISDEDFKVMRSEGVKGVIKRYNIKPWELPKVIAQFSSKLKVNLYPEVADMVAALSINFKLGILSSNSEDNIRQVLDKSDITNKFEFIYSQSSLFGKDKVMKKMCKEHQIEPSQIIYVGDEDRDIIACKKVGIGCIAVTYGFNDRERLMKTEPDYVVDTPLEVAKIVDQISKL